MTHTLSRVTLYTAGHLHTAVPHCSHSRAPIVHTAVPWENNEHGCVYLRCRAVCKLPGCVEGHPWLYASVNWVSIGSDNGSSPTRRQALAGLGHCQLDPTEQTSVRFYSIYKAFHSQKCIWTYRLRNGGHFFVGGGGGDADELKVIHVHSGFKYTLSWETTYADITVPVNFTWWRLDINGWFPSKMASGAESVSFLTTSVLSWKPSAIDLCNITKFV